jgi:RNA polymerase sigma factor (sigma-70 family)
VDSTDQRNDEQLLKLYAEQNDREALGVLFSRYQDYAYALARRICRNSATAEDCVQAAFLTIIQNASAYHWGSEQGVRAWLMASVIRACKNRIRSEVRRSRREDLALAEQDDVFVPDLEGGQEEDLRNRAREVLDELNGLPEHYVTAIWMLYYEGLSRKDVAATLEISEKTLDNQVQYGLKKLRQRLAERGITADIASIAAVVPFLPVEGAPDSLGSAISSMLAGPGRSGSVTGVKWGASLAKSAAVLAAIACVAAAVYSFWPQKTPDLVPPAAKASAPATATKPIDYHWDFNAPGVPRELVPVAGKVKHVPKGGPDGTGCLEIDGPVAEMKIDVPVGSFPVVVKWKYALVPTRYGEQELSTSFWFPMTNVVQFLDAGYWFNFENASALGRPAAWMDRVEYYSGSCIDRWTNGKRMDPTIGTSEPGGRVTLIFRGKHLIDDLTIKSVSPKELPDTSAFVDAVKKVPVQNRTGIVKMPHYKNPYRNVPTSVCFYPKIDGWALDPSHK